MKQIFILCATLLSFQSFAQNTEYLKIQPSHMVKERYILIEKNAEGDFLFSRCFDTDYDYKADYCREISPEAFSENELKKEILYLRSRIATDLVLSLGTLTIANRINPNIDPGRFLCKSILFSRILKSEASLMTYQETGCDVAGDDDFTAMISEVLSGIK